mgnify:CR=1 FL=1
MLLGVCPWPEQREGIAAVPATGRDDKALHRLIFVGIDVIGDYLTEINVTSPTGAQQLKRFSDVDAAALMWDAIEAKRAA